MTGKRPTYKTGKGLKKTALKEKDWLAGKENL